MDEHINWSDHVNYVLSKIAKNNGILSKIRFFIDKKIALLLYYTVIYHIVILCGHSKVKFFSHITEEVCSYPL